MIRDRGNPVYQRWSIGYHALVLAATAWVRLWAAGLFARLLVRAALRPGRGWSPKRVGLVEIGNCTLLLACIALR